MLFLGTFKPWDAGSNPAGGTTVDLSFAHGMRPVWLAPAVVVSPSFAPVRSWTRCPFEVLLPGVPKRPYH